MALHFNEGAAHALSCSLDGANAAKRNVEMSNAIRRRVKCNLLAASKVTSKPASVTYYSICRLGWVDFVL